MDEQQKLKIIIDNLKEGVNLSVFNFVNDKAILKDGFGVMYCCDVLFCDGIAIFINLQQKEDNFLTVADIF